MNKKKFFKISILTSIIFYSCFDVQYALSEVKKSEFKISVGSQSNNTFSQNETITLTGTSDNNSPTVDVPVITKKNMTREEMLEDIHQKGKNFSGKSVKSEEVNHYFNSTNALVFEGGKVGKTVEDSKIDLGYSKLNNFTSFSKEIPIPTNFNILKEFWDNDSQIRMPTSTAPKGLPEFAYKNSIVNDNELRSLLNSLNKKTKQYNKNNQKNHNNKNNYKETFEEVELNVIENKWYKYIKKESQLMMLSGLPMKIMVLASKDDLIYNFMLSEVANGSEKKLKDKKVDDGIYSVLGSPFINGREVPMCYIVFGDHIEEYNEKIIKPLEGKLSNEAIASLIVGHNVGICLDELERENKIKKQYLWSLKTVHKLGLYQEAVSNILPNGLKSNIWNLKKEEILNNNAQKQYQQNVADSFAILWAFNRGYKDSYQAYMETKEYLPNYSTHNTTNALKAIKSELNNSKINTLTLSKIWKIARNNQFKVGVSKELSNKDYNALYNEQLSALYQNKEKSKNKNYIPVNKFGKYISNTNDISVTKKNAEKIKPFNDDKTKNFEATKNNQLSKINFNVTALIKDEMQDKFEPKVRKEKRKVKTQQEINNEKMNNLKNYVTENEGDKTYSLPMPNIVEDESQKVDVELPQEYFDKYNQKNTNNKNVSKKENIKDNEVKNIEEKNEIKYNEMDDFFENLNKIEKDSLDYNNNNFSFN